MNENVDIFIGTHCKYNFPTNSVYKIIYNGTEKLNTTLKVYYEENEPLHDLFSDVIRMNYIRYNIILKQYIGLVQYKRYFNFYNDVPDINNIFNEYDIILPNKINVKLYNQFCECHCEYVLNEILNIIKILYPDYPSSKEDWNNIDFIYPHNMFIMKTNDFYRLCNFLFSIFDKFIYDNLLFNMNNVADYVNKHCSNKTKYQHRFFGFLGERLCTIYFIHNFKNPKIINVINK